MGEHYIANGLCTDFPDWSISAAGSEANLKIGYDHGRFVTEEEQEIEPDLDEEAVHPHDDQLVPDPQEERSMVATSAEVYTNVLGFLSQIIPIRNHNRIILFLLFTNCHLSCCMASGSRGARTGCSQPGG